MTNPTSNDRVAFEKWADEQGYELGRRAVPYTSSENRNGDYQSRTTQVSWLAWEACSEMRSVETSQSLALDLRSNLHGGPTPALHDGVTGKAKCVICGNFNRFWHVISGCNFCQSCVSEALSSPEEPSAPRESDWHCVHCGRDNDPSETHCVQCEWSRKHTIAGVLHERGCFDHPCICGAVKISCSRCGGSQVDPDPTYQPCKQCCPKAPEVRASDPHDGITPCPPESRCVECWPEKASDD